MSAKRRRRSTSCARSAIGSCLRLTVPCISITFQHERKAFDTTFSLLDTIAQLISLVLVIGIMSAQNTDATLEQERARLMLQLAVIHDRKITEALNAIETLRAPRRAEPQTDEELRRATDIHEATDALRAVEQEQGETRESES